MASTDTVIIANPAAGRAVIDRLSAMADTHHAVVLRLTERRGDDQRLARDACEHGATTLIAAGGDGTVHGVVNGMADHFDRTRLLVLPMGTANDFAAACDLPLRLEPGLALLHTGQTLQVDLIRAVMADHSSTLLINAATAGFSDAVHQVLEANPEMKKFWGRLAYLRAAVDALADLPRYHLTLEADGQRGEGEACAMMIANGRRAGGVTLAPAAAMDDQWLDLAIVRAETPIEMAGLAARVAFRMQFDSDHVLSRRAKLLRVQADPPMPFIGDGESLGTTPLRFEVVPRALQLIVPAADR